MECLRLRSSDEDHVGTGEKEMKTVQTRLGNVSCHPDMIIFFPHGLLGFGSLREFMLMPENSDDPLICLQSLENPKVTFLMVDPRIYFTEYAVSVGSKDAYVLKMKEDDQYRVLTTITVHSDRSITLNLIAPVVYVPRTQRAVQKVLEGTSYSVRTPLP